MTGRRATVVLNRQAGSGRRLGEVATVIQELVSRGWRVQVQSPESRHDVAAVVTRVAREGPDCLIVAGGDGTWHEVIQARDALEDLAAGSRRGTVPLALLPIGTGDDNARSLGIPIHDPIATAHLIDSQTTRCIDLGVVHTDSQRRWFSGVLSVGFDSQVNFRANGYRRLPGTLRYLVAAARELMDFTPSEYTITTESSTRRVSAMLIAIGNGGYYGGGMAICPTYSDTDGQLDATIIGALPRHQFVGTLPTVYSGRHIHHESVETLRSSAITIEGRGGLVFADGEPVGTVPIRVECVPHALTIVAP